MEMEKETLEEVAKRLYPIKIESCIEGKIDINSYERNLFIKGAKWQAERMYSEQEVLEMFHKFNMHLPLHYEFLVKEQFKKK